MLTISECLQATQLAITKSTEQLSRSHGDAAQIREQVILTKELIAQSLVTLRELSRKAIE